LRNCLAGRRDAGDSDSEQYLRNETDFFSEIEPGVQEAIALDNPLECERRLDALRWRRLDDIASQDSFSFNALAVYMIKLLLLEKWQPRNNENGYENLDKVIAEINAAPGGKN